MKQNSKITFLNEGEVVLVMYQTEGKMNLDYRRQFVFTLFNSENKKLGVLNLDLTKGYGYGYARAVAYIAKSLLPLFPKLEVEIHNYHSNGNGSTFKWTEYAIKKAIYELDRSL